MPRTRESPVLVVAARLYRSLSLFCLLVLVLYGLGNVQEFQDASQLMLLHVVRVTTLAGSLLGAYCVGYRVWLALRGSSVGWSLAGDGLLLAANLALLVGVELLFAWLQVSSA